MTLRFGPEYFEDKDPSPETARAVIEARAKGFTIAYPVPFLKKLNPNYVAPVDLNAQTETPDENPVKDINRPLI